VLCAIAFAVIWYARNANGNEPALNTVAVSRGDIQNLVSATGVLEPSDYVDVGAQVSGQLELIHVRVGQPVSTGDLLAEIDPTVYVAKVDATRAQLKNQQAQLADRKAQLRLAEIQFQRQQNLWREDATTRESLQTAEASLASARAQLAMLEAQIEQTSSTLRAEEANLGYARIYAPMDGTVVSIEARQGQTLNASQTAPLLMRIANLSTMRVRAQVSEADVGKLQPGMRVYFTTLGG
jgi:macrolide-specific efflux system membrane fusion protein